MLKNTNDSNNQKIFDVREKNLNLILDSNSYKIAQEDIKFIRKDEMRGVRMLLEITKPELVLEEHNIISTIIVFGGSQIVEGSSTQLKLMK